MIDLLYENIFETLLNKSHDLFIVVDDEGIILFANDPCKDFFEQPADQLVNQMIERYCHLLNIKNILVMVDSKIPQELEFTLLNGNNKILHTHAVEIRWQGKMAYLITCHDITNIKRVSQLRAEIEEHARIDQLKDEFIGVVSRELRTPLTIVKGAITNLKSGVVGPMSEKQNKVLETTNRNIDRLSKIIENLLDLSRIESGQIEINRRSIDLPVLIKEVAKNFTNILKNEDLIITTDIPKNIPTVYADPDMIVQVLNNLIQNAIKFAKTKITISGSLTNKNVHSKEELVQINVTDDGDGIKDSDIPKLFNKFRQINRPTGGSGYKGTGLGLAICKQIIHLHGGKIWANSKLGHYTKFSFSLPTFDHQSDFELAIEQAIIAAQKNQTPCSILSLTISNLDIIKEQCLEKDIKWMFADITKELRSSVLRKTDFILHNQATQQFLVILTNVQKESSEIIVKRIHNMTKDCFCPGKTGKIYCTLKIKGATFPDDSNNQTDIFKLAFENS